MAVGSRHLQPLRPVVLTGAGLILLVVVSTGIGLVMWREPAGAPAGLTGAAGLGSGADHLDDPSRLVTLGPATMRLPDDPYALYPDAARLPGLFAVVCWASAPVHAREGNRGWAAAVLVGRLAAGGSTDPEQRARDALRQLSRTMFDGQPTQLSRVSVVGHAVGGHPGVRLTARVHYRITGLPSRYDVVTMVVVRLDDGSLILATSTVPDDAPAELEALAAASLASLQIN